MLILIIFVLMVGIMLGVLLAVAIEHWRYTKHIKLLYQNGGTDE